MYAFKIACWALIFIFRLGFPPGVSIATILNLDVVRIPTIRGETGAIIGGGGYFAHLVVLPDEFLLKSVVIRVDFKINLSGRTRIY